MVSNNYDLLVSTREPLKQILEFRLMFQLFHEPDRECYSSYMWGNSWRTHTTVVPQSTSKHWCQSNSNHSSPMVKQQLQLFHSQTALEISAQSNMSPSLLPPPDSSHSIVNMHPLFLSSNVTKRPHVSDKYNCGDSERSPFAIGVTLNTHIRLRYRSLPDVLC